MPKIPNTDLILTEAEIQAVIDFAYSRGGSTSKTVESENDYKNSEEYKKYFNKNGENVTIDLDDCSILTKEMLLQ